MFLKKWEDLPSFMQNDDVLPYYNLLKKKKVSLFFKRLFDIIVSFLMMLVLLPLFLIIAIMIKCDSKGPVFYRQERVTRYGKHFRIIKFRTMVQNADKIGSEISVHNDTRITKVGHFLRKSRLDEIPQLINILSGSMTFVGTRPEVPKYVCQYTGEMMATLLIPAGVTSKASIYYKDEEIRLSGEDDTELVYIQDILPNKMYYNLKSIKEFGFWKDICTMFQTFFAVCGKRYKNETNAPEGPFKIVDKNQDKEVSVKGSNVSN